MKMQERNSPAFFLLRGDVLNRHGFKNTSFESGATVTLNLCWINLRFEKLDLDIFVMKRYSAMDILTSIENRY